MIYRVNTPIDGEALTQLYQQVGWIKYTTAILSQAYAQSLCFISAWEHDVLLGVIRAVGDDTTILYIQDLLVSPTARRQGIASALVENLLKRYAHVRQIVLLTDDQPDTKAFYESIQLKQAQSYQCIAYLRIQ